MLFDGIETAKAAVAPGEFQCSAQGEDAGLAAGGVKPQDENCATTAITVVTVMLVRAGHDDSPSTSRVMISRSDCSAAACGASCGADKVRFRGGGSFWFPPFPACGDPRADRAVAIVERSREVGVGVVGVGDGRGGSLGVRKNAKHPPAGITSLVCLATAPQ